LQGEERGGGGEERERDPGQRQATGQEEQRGGVQDDEPQRRSRDGPGDDGAVEKLGERPENEEGDPEGAPNLGGGFPWRPLRGSRRGTVLP